jgi:two-component system chemotaxis sensor kinase CheA
MNSDLSQYLSLFETETKENLKVLNDNMIKLEKNPEDLDILNILMRSAHTIKGMSGTMGFKNLFDLCHKLEDFFDAARQKTLMLDEDILQLLFTVIDIIAKAVPGLVEGQEENNYSDVIMKLENVIKEGKILDLNIIDELKSDESRIEKIKEIKVHVKQLDAMMNLMEEMNTLKMHFNEIMKDKGDIQLKDNLLKFERLVKELQDNIMKARLVRAGFLFERFPRMVRDLAKEQKKEIEIDMVGSDIEFDRTIVDELGEPLIHLIRNAIDHGIKKKGIINLNAKREKGYSIIEIMDNGEGIDLEIIKRKAIEKGIADSKDVDAYTEKELYDLMFNPMFSTSEEVTKVSGRGVGLSAVKLKIEELGGNIYVSSNVGEGTKFTLELPLTLAVIKALLVKVDGQKYAIPLNHVERIVKFDEKEIKKVMNKNVLIQEGEDLL